MRNLISILTYTCVLALAGCISRSSEDDVRVFSSSSDLQSYGREYCGQTVTVVGVLGYRKGGQDFRLDIGGDVLLRVPDQIAERFGRFVGRTIAVTGVLQCPRDRVRPTGGATREGEPTYTQAYESDYLLFTLDLAVF